MRANSTWSASSSRRRCTRTGPTCRPRRCSIRSPTRSTCASRSRASGRGASRRRCTASGVEIADLGYFRRHAALRPADPAAQARIHAAGVRRGGAARRPRRLRLRRTQPAEVDGREPARFPNRASFRCSRKPARAGSSTGWSSARCPAGTVGDSFHNNIAYTPGTWIALHRICRAARSRRPVPHPLRPLARDPDGPGHALDLPVPEGRGLRVPDHGLPRQGAGRRRSRLGGLGVRRADAGEGRLEGRPALPGPGRPGQGLGQADRDLRASSYRARHGTTRWPTCRTEASTGSTTSSRPANCSTSTRRRPPLIIEHEYGPARVQDKDALRPILAGSIAYARHIDRAAACMYALQHEVLAAQDIPIQGIGRQPYRS